jgi:hypothetical protein
MQSDRKHRKEPIPKMLAHEFAIPYSNSVEDLNKAILNAQVHEKISRESSVNKVGAEKKLSLNVSNFWNNVQGILLKHKKNLSQSKK